MIRLHNNRLIFFDAYNPWGDERVDDTGPPEPTRRGEPGVSYEAVPPLPNGWVYLTTEAQASAYLDSYDKALNDGDLVGIDIETTNLSPYLGEIRLVQIDIDKRPTLILDVFRIDLELLRPYLRRWKMTAYNASFERQWLTHNLGEDFATIHDAMSLSGLVRRNGRESLDTVVFDTWTKELYDWRPYSQMDLPADERKKKNNKNPHSLRVVKDHFQKQHNWSQPDLSMGALGYAAFDAYYAHRLPPSLS